MVKITQRFASENTNAEKSSSTIKNAFYTLQVDYSKNTSTDQNAIHKDKIFDYGYVGKFDIKRMTAYNITIDSNEYIFIGSNWIH